MMMDYLNIIIFVIQVALLDLMIKKVFKLANVELILHVLNVHFQIIMIIYVIVVIMMQVIIQKKEKVLLKMKMEMY